MTRQPTMHTLKRFLGFLGKWWPTLNVLGSTVIVGWAWSWPAATVFLAIMTAVAGAATYAQRRLLKFAAEADAEAVAARRAHAERAAEVAEAIRDLRGVISPALFDLTKRVEEIEGVLVGWRRTDEAE